MLLKIKNDHKDDYKNIYKETFDKLVIEKFDEIKELTTEINLNDLTSIWVGFLWVHFGMVGEGRGKITPPV